MHNTAFFPMLQGVALNKFRATSTKDITVDRNGNATIEQEGFKLFMENYLQLNVGLSTGAKKMLDLGAIALKRVNHYRPKEGRTITTTVSISLEEYGRLRQYDIVPRTTSTPDEERAEKKRLDTVMHDIRKRVNMELASLCSLVLSWTEPRGKKFVDYLNVRVLQSADIRNGYIIMRFSEDIASYLTHAYLMQYPISLQASDERNPRAYNVGYKLALHHSIDNNKAKGTASIISVKALLDACGDFPTYEEIQASSDRGHWERRIKLPLESALDINVRTGVIASWEFSNSKGVPLNDQQIDIADYQIFSTLYIRFEMHNAPDQSERLKRKAERIETSSAKKQRRKPTSKKEKSEGGN